VENATDDKPGAASVWQQRQKVHLLANSDRTLPALVVSFDEASAELTTTGQDRLVALLPALVGKRNKLEVRAHSTRRPLPASSPFGDHWQLCYERAVATMRFLETKGVEPERMRLSQSASYDPLTTRFETAWQDENNCVEVFLLTEVVEGVPGTGQAGQTQAMPVEVEGAGEFFPPAAPAPAAH
jgi:flagellar motor protein MotB